MSEPTRPPLDAITAALQVLVLDEKTREYLKANDPRALQQACNALERAGHQYQPRDAPADVCWYCVWVLEPNGVCRRCTDWGRQLPADVWQGRKG